MYFAGCRYGFRLCKSYRWENTALDIGKGKLCSEMVAFWQNGDGSCFRQGEIELREQGKKHNQEVNSYEKIRHKLSTCGLSLRYKRLRSCLCRIVQAAVDNRLRFCLFHNIHMNGFYWIFCSHCSLSLVAWCWRLALEAG